MRCHCCDKSLTEAEIQITPDKKFDMCSVCLEVAMDAAYSDGFVRPDEADSVHIIEDDPLFVEEYQPQVLVPVGFAAEGWGGD